MDKRMLLAIILSIAILITYQYLMPTAPPVAPVKDAKEAVKEEDKSSKAVPHAAAPSLIPKPDISGIEKEIKVENDLYIAVLTSRGGAVKSIELKKYKDKNNRPIVLKGDTVLQPMSMGIDEEFQFSNVNFSVKGKDLKLDASSKTADLIFEYSAGGRSIRRTYTFHGSDYGIDLKDETGGFTSYWITLGKNFGIYEKDDSTHFGPVILKDADRIEFTAKDLKETKNFREGVKWIAQEDKYFFSSLVPKGQIEEAKAWNKNGDMFTALRFAGGVNNYFIYAGPKEYDSLKKIGAGLEHIVDFGFFSILARPLFWLMKLFYGIFPNYGVAIIILTILVRIPFIPLINKGQASMKKLQDIQPRMAEIKEKYKSDPQRMQKELMELYKKNKVNPMGGCLPMLLQIPVFFALYKVLLIAIELRGAPFMLWIHDLSAPDKLFGQIGGITLGGPLPILMGITMVIQQKMTPSSMDPTQQKIMMIMPIVFTFMFLTFPSGLVLYWLVNNVLSIVQQWHVNKKLKKQQA